MREKSTIGQWFVWLVRSVVPRRLRAEDGSFTRASWAWCLLLLLWLLLVVFLVDAQKPWDEELWRKPVEDFRYGEWVVIGLWWGGLVNLVVCTVLLATACWWMRLERVPMAEAASGRLLSWRWVLVVAGAMVFAGVQAWPRLSLSLWGDEEHSLRQCVLGEYKMDEETGILYYRPHPIGENLWMYVGPNNHFLFTLAARLCLEVWHVFFWRGGLYFDEAVYRLPSFLAGLLTVPALALFLRSAGFKVAGAIGAWTLAIHPWFLRYMGEARGYALMMLFMTLGAWCLLSALRRRRWRDWALFALCELLFLYAYPGALYLAVTLNVGAVVAILMEGGFGSMGRAQLWRWGVTNTFAAMAAIQLMAPCVPQMALWLQRERAKADLGFPFIQDFWGFLTSGMAWHVWDPANPFSHTLTTLRESQPLAFHVLFWLPIILLPLGVLRFAVRSGSHAALAFGLVSAAPLGFFVTQMGGNILYVWYLIFSLPAYAAFTAVGMDAVTWVFVRPWRNLHNLAPGLMACCLLGMFFWATSAQRETLRTVPTEPQRESVLLTRPSLDPYDPSAESITTVNVTFTTPFYDPRAIKLDEDETGAARLRQLMLEARAEGRELYVNLGSEGLARHVFPKVMAMLDNTHDFELVQRLYGLELQNTRLVFKMLPASSGSAYETEPGEIVP